MERRLFGRTGMEVSLLGFGGAEIGFGQAEPALVERLLNSALDAGLNVIDTAAAYQVSEERIGQAVGHRRGDFYLFTKCAGWEHGESWKAGTLMADIDRSLARLKTDCVDLIQLHSCSKADLEAGEAIETLQRAREAGKTRFIGYSGDGEAAKYAIECGAFDSLQTSINIADQEAIDLTIPLALASGIGVIVKRPIANAAWREGRKPDNEYAHTYWDRLQELRYDFLAEPVEDAVSKAMRFTASVPAVCTMIVGTMNPDRWVQNAAMLAAGQLPAAEYEAIRARWKEVAGPDWVGQT